MKSNNVDLQIDCDGIDGVEPVLGFKVRVDLKGCNIEEILNQFNFDTIMANLDEYDVIEYLVSNGYDVRKE